MLKTDAQNFSCIRLIDQNLGAQKPEQYTYQTLVTLAGQRRFTLDTDGSYVQVKSAKLRRSI